MSRRGSDLDPSAFSGLTVAITGGARGIGRATAALLRAAGADVVIGDRDVAQLEAAATELGVRWHPLDVTSTRDWAAFAAEAGAVDVLVNNAGIMPLGELLKESEEVTRQIFEVNTFGVIAGMKALAPGMVERGQGHIINIASAVGRVALAGGATYSASKHAVVGLSEAMREELAPHGVDVSMVLPVIVRTELSAGVPETRGVPPVTAEQVAEVIAEVIAHPVPEAWVPRWSQPVAKSAQLLPRRLQAVVSRALKADTVLTGADTAARATYEREARRHP